MGLVFYKMNLLDKKTMTEKIKTELLLGLDQAISRELVSTIVESLKEIRVALGGMDM